MVLQNEPDMTIRNRIKIYLKEQSENNDYIDFCCVGNRGINYGSAAAGDNYLGTVAREMISMRRLNVLFFP